MAKSQNESDIRNLSGLQAVREKVSMYLGGTDGSAMETAVREPLDNCVDEASAGRNKLIHLFRVDPLTYWIVDQGGGMPVGDITIENPLSHKMEKVSALRALVGLMHTGGKFDASSEDGGMRGTHGVGIKGSNAVSDHFKVFTCRSSKWYTTEYKKGKETVPVTLAAKAPTLPDGTKMSKGTAIVIKLDVTVFDKGSAVSMDYLRSWFEMTAAFSEDITMKFSFINDDDEWEETEWECKGAEDYLERTLVEYDARPLNADANFVASGKLWNLALSFTDYDGVGVRGFSNGLLNKDGGFHVNSVYDALSSVIAKHAKKGHTFTPTDLRDGMVGVINLKLTSIKFHNQEKSKVADDRAGAPLRDEIIEQAEEFFNKRKALAELLCERATKMASLKQEFKKNKRVMKVLSDARKKGALPNKLAVSLGCSNEERELFLVEGDSAAGSGKRARDSSFQEVLPLKGKIPNAMGSKASVAIENEEILAMLTAIGYDPSLDEPFENLRVGRVILLTDADVDGLHIQNLILAALVRFVPQLLADGRVYIARRYEYMTRHKGKFWFSETLEGLSKIAPASAMSGSTHLKGLGELDSDVLSEMAFSPEHRHLIQLTEPDSAGVKRITLLAGTEGAARKELLGLTNGN